MQKKWTFPQGCVLAFAIYTVLAAGFYFVAGSGFFAPAVYAGASLVLGFLFAGYLIKLCHDRKKGKSTLGLKVISAFIRYRFLMQQLVARDFKTKYKRSVLGVLWSFLNPLLTMAVQYLVFSTLFKSDIPNFPVYLLTGIVLFNFFNEACAMGITSVLGNASLITKVYVPKYIYPLTRVTSSAVNLLFSLVPLLIVMLLTKTPLTPVLLLLPFPLVCLFTFCVGMVFILSASMVFFRDTQFLWNVLSMIWMYATPIFYPESIIPQAQRIFSSPSLATTFKMPMPDSSRSTKDLLGNIPETGIA